MSQCPLYQVHLLVHQSFELRPTGELTEPRRTPLPWCMHRASPVTELRARAVGRAGALACEGDLARCQVPLDKR